MISIMPDWVGVFKWRHMFSCGALRGAIHLLLIFCPGEVWEPVNIPELWVKQQEHVRWKALAVKQETTSVRRGRGCKQLCLGAVARPRVSKSSC